MNACGACSLIPLYQSTTQCASKLLAGKYNVVYRVYKSSRLLCSLGSFTNDEIRHRVLNLYAKFVTDVEPDRLSDWLVQENVISVDEMLRIRNANHTAPDRCRAFLSHLFTIQHPRAFLVVREALRERNHHLLEHIDNLGVQLQTDIAVHGEYSCVYVIYLTMHREAFCHHN